jgi:hypothetical protein
VNVSPIQHVGH